MNARLRRSVLKAGLVIGSLLITSTISTNFMVNADTNQQSTQNSVQQSYVQSSEDNQSYLSLDSSNKQYDELTSKINAVNNNPNLNNQDKVNQKQQLLNQYNGAEASYIVQPSDDSMYRMTIMPHVQEKVVDGGINDYASTYSGLVHLRELFGADSLAYSVGSKLTAGIISNTYLKEAQSDIKTMISQGRHKGGFRITATEEFAIPSINSKKEIAP